MTIGKRLAEERKRLNLSQEELGLMGGVKKNAQFQYETDERSPKADYLSAIAQGGVDVTYILTGQHNLKYSEEMVKKGLLILDNTGLPQHLKTADFVFDNIEFYRDEFKPVNDDGTPFDGEVKPAIRRGRPKKA